MIALTIALIYYGYQYYLKKESNKLIRYFLASLAVPEDQMWVNLSPYEKNRIIPESFGQTEMGRDLLMQDYMLKQLTASLMYPDEKLGEEFWKRVYVKAQAQYGITEIPMNTFNKIWIVPERAEVYVHEQNVFVVDSYLKVMLEEDYLSAKWSVVSGKQDKKKDTALTTDHLALTTIKEILIPAIEREVNEGKTFANLRQIYNASILATWFKQNLKESVLGQIYMDQGKTKGVDIINAQGQRDEIYAQYVAAFKKGAFDLIKEEYDPATQQIIPRKYFSGGMVTDAREVIKSTNRAMLGLTAEKRRRLLDPIDGPFVTVSANVGSYAPDGSSVDLLARWAGMGGDSGTLLDQKATEEERILKLWETSMTDPRYHSDDHFQYMVHGVPSARDGVYRLLQQQMLLTNGKFVKNQKIELLVTPNRVSEKKLISTSLINQDHQITYTQGGFILRIPSDNILETLDQGDDSNFSRTDEDIEKVYRTRKLKTPADMIDEATDYSPSFNEIVVQGTGRKGEKVEIQGVFIQISPENHKPLDQPLAIQLRNIAQQYGWPIIEIMSKVIFNKEPKVLYRSDKGRTPYIQFDYQGERYYLKPHSFFSSKEYLNRYGVPVDRNLSPSNIQEAIIHLEQILLGKPNAQVEEVLQGIKETYSVNNSTSTQSPPDKAQSATVLENDKDVGGIDLNPTMMNLRAQGQAELMRLPRLTPQQIQDFNIDDLYPVIMNVTPVTNLPQLLGFDTKSLNDLTSFRDNHRSSDSKQPNHSI